MSSPIEGLIEALRVYTKADKQGCEQLRKLAEEAEEDGHYYDYDQACYDHWEGMTQEGAALAEAVRYYLEANA